MSNKDSRAGGKYSGNHTTLVPAAAVVCDIAHDCSDVTKISPGYIKAGLRCVHGQKHVKLTRNNGGILLSVRDNTSHQDIQVFTRDAQVAMLTIVRGARNANIGISFSKTDKKKGVGRVAQCTSHT